MGYDLHCRGDHLDEEALNLRLRELHPLETETREVEIEGVGVVTVTEFLLPEATDGEDHTAEFRQLDEMQRESLSYFRANNWGMSVLRQGMFALKALDMTPHPPWPKLDSWRDDQGELVPEAEDFLSFSGESDLIPIDKLGSNDHWIITPAQAWATFRVCEGEVPTIVSAEGYEDGWERWLDFLNHISDHGGAYVD